MKNYFIYVLLLLLIGYGNAQNDKTSTQGKQVLWGIGINTLNFQVPDEKINTIGWQVGSNALFRNKLLLELNGGILYRQKESEKIINIQSYYTGIQKNIPRFEFNIGYVSNFNKRFFYKVMYGISNLFFASHNDATYYAIYNYYIGCGYRVSNKFYLNLDLGLRNCILFSECLKVGMNYRFNNTIEQLNFKSDSVHHSRLLQFELGIGIGGTLFRFIYLSDNLTNAQKQNTGITSEYQNFMSCTDFFMDTRIKFLTLRGIYRYYFPSFDGKLYVGGPTGIMNYLLIGFGNKYKDKKFYYGIFFGGFVPGVNYYIVKAQPSNIIISDGERVRMIFGEIGLKLKYFDIACYLYRLGLPINREPDKIGDKLSGYKYLPANIQSSFGLKLSVNLMQ